MITKNGICLNVKESEYKSLKYGLLFYFSSKLYLEKFESNVEKYVNEESLKIKNKYKMNANFEVYLAISFYKKIEKRGFYIFDDVMKAEIKTDTLIVNTIVK